MIADQRAREHGPVRSAPVELADDVEVVRRLAVSVAAREGFTRAGSAQAERVAADMAAHLVQRGQAGRMLVRSAEWGGQRGVELLSADGAGTYAAADVRAIAAAADQCEVYTAPGHGTAMMVRLSNGPQTGAPPEHFLVGSRVEPIEGEVVSGDASAVEQHDDRVVVLVADGLGHGEEAAAASAAAVAELRVHHREPVENIAAHVHRALRLTRGAAIALAEIDLETCLLRFCGIGNITARLLTGGGVRELVSLYGIAGYQRPRIQVFTRSWSDDALLLMHSDGLSSRWNAADYPGLHLQHPQLAASTMMRDAASARDDALVLAVRSATQAAPAPVSETGR